MRTSCVLFLLAIFCAVAPTPVAAQRPTPVYPEASWEFKTPEEVGLDPEKLSRLSLGRHGCIVRYGYMVKTWGDPTFLGPGGSETKPFFTHFLFKAVEEGRLPSIHDKVVDFEPRLRFLNPDLAYKDREITWAQTAMQTSCYGTRDRPGTAYDYNDYNMALFGDTLYFQVYGAASWDEVTEKILRLKLTLPMQWEDNQAYDHHGRLRTSARDHCRFGLLYLRKGKWKDRQLLSAENAAKIVGSSLPGPFPRTEGIPAQVIPGQRTMGDFGGKINQVDHGGSYSFAWWTNGITREGKRYFPDAPPDVFGCRGGSPEIFHGMVVFPSLDLIVAWRRASKGEDQTKTLNRFFKELMAAVTVRK